MNQKKILKFIAALTLFIPIHLSFTQTLPLKHYSDKDGLASSVVNCIFQDSSGFLWFGTEHGLNHFDGTEFQNPLPEEGGLKDEYITDIFEDRKGNLWIATRGGGLICKNPHGIKTYTTKDGLPGNRIWSITEDREGNLWLGTRSGISMFNGKSFTTYTKKDGLNDDLIQDIITDENGDIWLASQNGVSYLRKKNGNSRFINYTTENGLISNEVYNLMMDRKGNIWIGTKDGLNCYQKKTASFISYTVKDGLSDNFVYSIIEDRNGNIWIGTDRGVSRFSPSPGKFSSYYAKNGFPGDKIYTIFEDREGNIWFGTNMGVSRLHSLKITNFSVRDGLPNNSTHAIIEEMEGKYWIGTELGLSFYSDGTFKNYTADNGLIGNSIYNLLKDSAGDIWIAADGGVGIYSSKGGKFTNYSIADGLPGEIALSLAEDRKGTIWIGTDMGVCRFSNGRIAPPNFNFKQDALPVHAMLYDRRGNLWFSDTKVLRKISTGGDESTNYHYSVGDGLIHPEIKSLFEDSRGSIWIGTQRGLSCLSNGKFTNYTTADGLSDNVCFFVLEDDSGKIWIGTGNGVNRFDGKSFKKYTSRDGLISNEMRVSACLKDSRGNLWFGTVKGITRFNPRLDRDNKIPPPVYITGFNIWGKNYPISDNIRLKYDQNYLKFDFVGLCYTSPEDVVYEYRMDGIDRDWVKTGSREASYTSLGPRKYVFQVKAKNNDGIESVKPAEIRFRILPPFWETWWFRAISFLALLAAAFAIVLFKIKRVKEKVANEAKNRQLVMAQRMKLLGILAGGAVHDLKNLLGIIIGYSDLATEYVEEDDEDEKSEALEVIKNTADTAFHVVKQMLAFTRQTYDEATAANLRDLLDEILDILKVTIPKKVTILWEPPKEKVLLYINPVKFKQVVMNLCLNAVQAMEGEGELKISLFKDPAANQVTLEISDTGPGIEQEIQEKIFDPLFTTKEEEKGAGLGLFVVKQIVDEYGGKIRLPGKPGEGTTFRISFPVQKPPHKEPTGN